MKKLLMILSVMVIASGCAMAEVILAPQWAELCPSSYLNAKASKWNSDSDYWYNRRIQFDESLARCNGYQGDDLKSCYSQVREAELKKNSIWNTKVEAREMARQQSHQEYIDYRNRTQTINAVSDIVRTLSK